MTKSKKTGEGKLMEVSNYQSPPSVGVLTRAKTLALKRIGQLTAPETVGSDDFYMQLRSRLLKKRPVKESKRKKAAGLGQLETEYKSESVDVGTEASLGENVVEFGGGERSASPSDSGIREITPCSSISAPNTIRTPGSTSNPAANSTAANGTVQDSIQMQAKEELEACFARMEAQQIKEFIDKYNFDPVNEKPLPGRYEWVKVEP